MSGQAQVEHLVVTADTLAQGAAWCEATLGVTPRDGGEHPLMDTHNRLLQLHAIHPRLSDLQAAHAAMRLQGVNLEQGAPNLVATLATPQGIVVLELAGA